MNDSESSLYSDYEDEDRILESSILFISAPKSGKSSLIHAMTTQSDPPFDEIPEVFAPKYFEVPIGSHDGGSAKIVMNLHDTKSFEYSTSESELLKNIEYVVNLNKTDMVILLIDSTRDIEYKKNIIKSTLKVMQNLKMQFFIIITKTDILENDLHTDTNNGDEFSEDDSVAKGDQERENHDIGDELANLIPEALVPELLKYSYYRGSSPFGFYSDQEEDDDPYESEDDYDDIGLFQNVMTKITYEITNAIYHPVNVLLDSNGEITPKFNKILKRVFWVLQNDNKCGYIDDTQIKKIKSFILGPEDENEISTGLSSEKIETIFEEIMELNQELSNQKIFTINSLEKLMKKLIELKAIQITWSFLYMFGYDEDLELEESFINTLLNFPNDEIVGISEQGESLLLKTFSHFDQNNDGLLSLNQLKDIFEFADSSPFPEDLSGVCKLIEDPDTREQFLPLSSWMCLWNIVVLQDPVQLARHLLIWGFDDLEIIDIEKDISVYETRPPLVSGKRSEYYESKIFIVYIFGASRSGKTALRASLIGKPFDSNLEIDYPFSGFTTEYYGKEVTVILRECDSEILDNQQQMSWCDACLFIFDGSDRYSFSVLPTIHRRLNRKIPAMYIQSHAESEDVEQEYEETPKAFWEALGLPSTPQYYSATHDNEAIFQEIREMILVICSEPDLGQIKILDENDDSDSEDLDERTLQRKESRKVVSKVLILGAGALTIAGAGYIAYRFLSKSSKKE